MKGLIQAAIEGFVGSLLLAGAIIVVVFVEPWRNVARLCSAFVRNEPLEIVPGRKVKLP